MEVVKTTDEYTIYQKRSKRYAVKQQDGWVNGEEKARILNAEGLIKLTPARPAEAAPEGEAEADAATGGESSEGGGATES